MFEVTDYMLNIESIPSNIYYKSFKTYVELIHVCKIPAVITETLIE